jgi:glycerol kinase
MWQLTGGKVHVTDVSNASRTMLFNVHTHQWDADLLEALHIPASLMPQVKPSSAHFADTDAGLFDRPLPIGGVAGDQQSALFGQACFEAGMAKNTYGTGCFLLMNTGRNAVASTNNLVTTVAWTRDKVTDYALEGSVFIGGAAVQWLRDGLKLIRQASEIEALAASVPDNGGVYFVPAFAGLGAPHWDAYARGAMFGLTRGATAGHLARATLESIAYQSADVLAAMERDSGITLAELRVDGGATASNLLMQFQADLLGVPVVRSKVQETTALGAAYLAGLAVGFWKGADEVKRNWRVDARFEPAMSRDQAQSLRAQWDKAVTRSKSWSD